MEEIKKKAKQEQGQPVLTFSPRLRHALRLARRQLVRGEGQSDITINKEVETWLSK